MFSNFLACCGCPCVLYRWIVLQIQLKKYESVNPGDQGLPALDPYESVRSKSHGPAEPNEALLRISQDMTRVLERLTAPKAR